MPINNEGCESNESGFDRQPKMSRRRWLTIAGVGLGVGLAGCTDESGEDNTNDTDDSGGSDSPIDSYWTAPTSEEPQKLQWNIFNPLNYAPDVGSFLFDPLAVYFPTEEEFRPVLAEDWSFENDTVTISIRDQTWTTDDPVTATDVATKFRLLNEFDMSGMDLMDGVNVVDDKTVELNMVGEVNEEYFYQQIFGIHNLIDTPESVFGEYLEGIQDADSESGKEDARQELVEFQWEDPVVTGPFQLEDQTSQKLVLETRGSGHPVAEDLNFDGAEFDSSVGVDTRLAAINNGQIDHTNINATESKLDQLSDHIETDTFPWFTGIGLMFNYDRDVFQHAAFRKALAYLLDRKLSVRNVAPLSNSAHRRIHGMTGVDVGTPEQWIGDTWEDFEEYGYEESKTEEASEVLTEAGFTKQDETWHKPNGDPIEELEVVGPSGWSWIRMIETAVEQFNGFGIPASVRGVDPSILTDQTWPQQDFDMVTCELGGQTPYPVGNYQKLFTGDIGGKRFQNPTTGMPLEFEVPEPVGDPDGSLTTINVQNYIDRMGTAEPEEVESLIRELAWLVNQKVPLLPVYDKVGYKAYDTSEWQIPPGDDPIMEMSQPIHAMALYGEAKAKTE